MSDSIQKAIDGFLPEYAVVIDANHFLCGEGVCKRRHVADTGEIWWLAAPAGGRARGFLGLGLETGLDDVEGGHCRGRVSGAGRGAESVLVRAVIVEPVAAATIFAWKRSIDAEDDDGDGNGGRRRRGR